MMNEEGEKHFINKAKSHYFTFEDDVVVLFDKNGNRISLSKAPKYGKTMEELKEDFVNSLPKKRRRL